jgi:hypothetical protein
MVGGDQTKEGGAVGVPLFHRPTKHHRHFLVAT